MSAIRVLNVVSNLSFGGVQSFLMNNYYNFDKTEIIFDFVVEEITNSEYEQYIINNGGHIYLMPNLKNNPLLFKKYFYDFLKNNRYRIVHIHHNFLSFLPVLSAKKANIKNIIVHSHASYKTNSLFSKAMRILSRHFINKYSTTKIACSKLSSDWLFGNKTSSIIIPNGICSSSFLFNKNERDKIRRELGLSSETAFVNVASLTKVKNQLNIIKSFQIYLVSHPCSKLFFVGDGEEKKQLMAYVENNCLTNNVYFLGQRKDVFRLLNAFDCFILASYAEGFSVSCIEAQTNGIPCILSNSFDNNIYVNDNLIIVDPYNIDSLVEGFVNASNLSRTSNVGKTCLFDIKITSKKLARLYKSLN